MGTVLETVETTLGNHLIVGSVDFSLEKLKTTVEKSASNRLKTLQLKAIKNIEAKMVAAKSWIKSQSELFNESIVSFKDFVQMKHREIKIAKNLIDTRVLLNEFDEILNVIKASQFGVKNANDLHLRVTETNMACEVLINLVCSMESALTKLEEKFEVILKNKIDKTLDRLNALLQETIDPELLVMNTDPSQPLGKIARLQERFEKESIKLEELKNNCTFLGFDIVIDSTVVSQIELSLKYRSMLWEMLKDIQTLKSRINHLEISSIKIEELDAFIKKKSKNMKSLVKHLPECKSLETAAAELKMIEDFSPFYKAVLSPYLRDSHFEELGGIFRQIMDPQTAGLMARGSLTLEQLSKLELSKVRQNVIGVAVRAYHEDLLQAILKELKNKWAKAVIPFMALPHNTDIIGLGDLRQLENELEDSLHTLEKIMANKYVGVIAKDTDEFQKTLVKVGDAIVKLNSVQRKFIFFDNMFMSPDMKKQMPAEGTAFDNAAKIFLGVLKKIESKNLALTVYRVPQFDDNIAKLVTAFDGLERNLEKHLEIKRQKFSRLYLMSDTELLDMLANFYKNIDVFNQYLSKMFDSVSSIRVVEEGGEVQINGIYSENQELISFPEISFHSKGSLEDVMADLLAVMHSKVKEMIFKRYDELLDGTRMIDLEKFDMEKFTKENVMQSTLVSLDCYLGQLLVYSVGKGNEGFLENVLDTCFVSKLRSPDIQKLGVVLGFDDLNDLQRIRLSNVVLLMVKYRDNAVHVIENNLESPNCFFFASQ